MHDHSRRTLVIASLATLATFLDTTVLFVAFPAISRTFTDASPSQLSWVLNAYTIVFAALLIPAGKLADRVGHRQMFLAGSTVFTVASMACGLAPSVEVLIGFRVLQAAGAAALIPSSLALVMHAFAQDRLPRAVAIWGAAGAVAGALGPTAGAAIVEGLGWRWVLFLNLPVGIFTVVAGARTMRESRDPETRVPSLWGVGMVMAAAGLLSLGVVGSEEFGWLSTRTLAVLGAGLAVLALFVTHQQRTEAPVLDLDLFRISNFTWGNITMLVFGTAFAAMFFGSILFLTDVWGWSILQAGLGVAPGPLIVGIVAPQAGTLAGRIGQRPILLAGGALFALSGALRLALLGADVDYVGDYLPSVVLSGLAVAFCLPQLASVVAQALPRNRIGVGGAALQSIRQFGGTFGVALTIAFLGSSSALTDPVDAFDSIWWLIVAGGLGTCLLVLPMRTTINPRSGALPPTPQTTNAPSGATATSMTGAPTLPG
ncbi:MAG TPA: DHA2 family efflux MFS transporter permease subunit [Euzebya sp.]|nr:DHA2 family efflux MFS transporter permease subunit [Euzebya sp.]